MTSNVFLIFPTTISKATLLATSCSDKYVYVYDLNTFECVAQFCGHSEFISDLRFSSDGRHIITVSVDGCIFVWRLSSLLLNICNGTSVSQNVSHQSTQRQTATWLKARANSLSSSTQFMSTSNSNPTNLSQAPLQEFFHPNLKHQQSLDTILDSNDDYDDMPLWAKQKLSEMSISNSNSNLSQNMTINTNANSIAVSSMLSDGNSSTSTLMDQQGVSGVNTRRSRAVWGPPVLNDSFAIMDNLDPDPNDSIWNKNSLLESNIKVVTSKTSLMSINNRASQGAFLNADDIGKPLSTSTNIECSPLASLQDADACEDFLEEGEEIIEEEVIVERAINEEEAKTPIQFPSPHIDKEFFQVKPVRLQGIDMADMMK
jgi:WD40 repeat protein